MRLRNWSDLHNDISLFPFHALFLSPPLTSFSLLLLAMIQITFQSFPFPFPQMMWMPQHEMRKTCMESSTGWTLNGDATGTKSLHSYPAACQIASYTRDFSEQNLRHRSHYN